MEGFVTWVFLATYAGACFAVTMLTQFTKELPWISKLPTYIWSYILALIILYPAQYFIGTLTFETAALTLINAAIVSLSANGAYSVLTRKKNLEKPKG